MRGQGAVAKRINIQLLCVYIQKRHAFMGTLPDKLRGVLGCIENLLVLQQLLGMNFHGSWDKFSL